MPLTDTVLMIRIFLEYIQGVMERPPLVAGFALAFMSMGWVVAATFSEKVMFKYGFRRIVMIGGIWTLMGSIFFITLQPQRG